jgi:hypothetical protein
VHVARFKFSEEHQLKPVHRCLTSQWSGVFLRSLAVSVLPEGALKSEDDVFPNFNAFQNA